MAVELAWLSDVANGLRMIARRPRFAVLVCLTLGVAIGASTVIFSFVNGLVLEPLPLGEPNRVVLVYSTNSSQEVARGATSLPDFLDWCAMATSFEELAAGDTRVLSLETPGGPVAVRGRRVTAGLFRAWGLTAALGRTMAPGEDRPGAPPVVILSHGFWRRQFGSDPAIVGRTVSLDGRVSTIIGVLTPGIEIGDLALTDVWMPLTLELTGWPRSMRTLQVTGLRKSQVTVQQANAEFRRIAGQLSNANPETNDGWSASVLPFAEAMAVPETWLVLALASLAVALVLLVACANVASLMLARGIEQRSEVAIRLALGASRGRIVRPAVIEAMLLALAGGGAGLLLAFLGLDVVRAVTFHPFFQKVQIDLRVLGFVLALSLVTPLLFGLGPALAASRLPVNVLLKDVGTGSLSSPHGRRLRGFLVAAQMAVALALLVVCVLTVSAAILVRHVDLGFEGAHTLLVRVNLPELKYPTPLHVATIERQLVAALAELHVVRAAAAASRLPVLEREHLTAISGHGTPADRHDRLWAASVAVSGDYFAVMGIPILAGRSFSTRDTAESKGVAVLSDQAARLCCGGRDRALGTRIRLAGEQGTGSWLDVVGVVGNVRSSVGEITPRPYVYVSLAQYPERSVAFVVRTPAGDTVLPAAVREAVRAIDPQLAVHELRTIEDALYQSHASDRLVAGFFGAFALVAVWLASTGLFGLMSYSVQQRTREIGLRVMLGARPADILSMILLSGLRLAMTGAAVGVVFAYPLAQGMRGAVRGVGTADAALYLGPAGLLAGIAIVACYIPARRVMGVDPAKALRHE